MAPKKKNRYHNPANDLVNAGEDIAKRALRALKVSAERNARAINAATGRTKDRLDQDFQNDTSLRAQLLRERHAVANAPKNGDVTVKEGNTFIFKDGNWTKPADVKNYKDAQGNLYDGNSGQLIKAAPAAAPRLTPPVSPPPVGPSVHAPRVEQAAPVFPTEKAYGESGKDLYMAGKGNNPLMQRMFGYQTGKAPDQVSQAPAAATPAPTPAPAVKQLAESLFEQMQRRKGKLRGAGYSDLNDIG